MSKKEENIIRTGLEIAVIGMSGRFPGAKNIDEFWDNLKNGVESISFFSDEELIESGVNPELLKKPNYVKASPFLENKEYFDSLFFNYTAREAEIMDPQFRFLHECSWEALEVAGYNPEFYKGIIGVYVGCALNTDWITRIFTGSDSPSELFEAGTFYNRNFLGSRVSYKLDLKGPSFTVQTACSTSLVAIHLACQGLIGGECDIALAGGVSITNLKKSGYLYEEGMIVSPDGHCRAFDAKAKGTNFGDGIGVVVLKSLENAVEDGDYIYAIVKGSAINNDGNQRVSYTAPGIKGEAAVIKAAYHAAEVNPESISYIETHGTGTNLGDFIEIEALKRAFNTKKKGFCAIGSVKTNVGHLNSAAGVSGLIKTVLTLNHKLIPPSLHFTSPNPKIDFENSPFYVNQKLREWERDKNPLRAGVSSFGIGGTNAHVVLEEYSEERRRRRESRKHRLILLSARTGTALEQATQNIVNYLKKNPTINLTDAAYTLQVGRKVFQHRRMLVCSDVEETIKELSSSNSEKVHTFCQEGEEKRSVVFMFPGQGSQYVNMGLELYQKEVLFRREMDRCFGILKHLIDYDIKEILYPTLHALSFRYRQQSAASHKSINQPEISQVVIFIFEYSLARLLMKWGITPHSMIGYSFGEYVAACIAGVFSLEDALKLVVFRGRLIQKIDAGAMLSVPLPRKELEPLLDSELAIAIDNGSSCVVSGPREAVETFDEKMKQRRYLCMRLPAYHAIHSKMMEPILEEFETKVREIMLNKPQIPYISNITGKRIKDHEATDPTYWAKHLKVTVKFADGLKELLKESDLLFVEIGPGHELSSLLLRHLEKNQKQMVINLVRHQERKISDVYFLLSKIGILWLYGIKINWSAFYPEKGYRIPLPTYPFERRRYWIEGAAYEPGYKKLSERSSKRKKADIADWFYLPQWERSQLLPVNRRKIPEHPCWLIFIDETGFCSQLVERLSQEIKYLVIVAKGSEFQKVGELKYKINPEQNNDYHILLEELQKIDRIPDTIIHLWGLSVNAGKNLYKEVIDDAQGLGLYSILYLVQAIDKQEFIGETNIFIVSNMIHEVTGDEIIVPQNATVIGLAKVIPQEYRNINCRCIDVELPEAGSIKEEKLINHLLVEFISNSIDKVIAYRVNYRWVQTFKPIRLEDPSENVTWPVNERVYLIIGGLGDIGFTLAKYLAKGINVKLILTGRTMLPPKSEWEKYLASFDKTNSSVVKILRMLELEGMDTEVLYFNCDVADYDQMQSIVDFSEEKFGKINEIIHSAVGEGSLNRTINEIGKKEFQQQFQSKVYGLMVLEKLFQEKELDFCLLISSPASILGGLGHAAYSAANQFIDAFVYWYNRINSTSWITVNWGDWLFEDNGGGMNIPFRDPLGYLRLTPEEGINTFQRILSHCPVNQVVVSAADLQERINDWVRFERKRETDEPGKNKSTTVHTRSNLLTPYVAPGSQMEKILSDIWGEHFGLEKVGINDNFFDLGATSLDIIQLSRKLKDRTGKDVPLTTFFRYSNIHSLALHLIPEKKQQVHNEKEIKRSDKMQQKRKNIQNRTKIRKNIR